ncbi:MRPS10 family protein [Megaselia abdita]
MFMLRNTLSSKGSAFVNHFKNAAKYSTETVSALKTTSTPAPQEQDKLFSHLEVELKGVDPAVLKSYSWFATKAANHLGIEVGECYAPRKAKHDRMTLLKSVHIYKKHRVQYEIRTYFRYMNFHKMTGSTLDTYLEYIERNLPEGVALKATSTELQALPEHLKDIPSVE